MHILIIGGGVAGLALAGLIDNSKHRVVILEQDSPEDFAKKWHWHDNLNIAELRRLGYTDVLPQSFPEQEDRIAASPSGKFKLRFKMKKPFIYEQVYRPVLLSSLYEKAREKSNLRYDTHVESLLIENGRTAGAVLLDGQEIRADLTIDCTGITELSRPLLGELYRGDEEIMHVFRGLFPREQKDSPPAADCITLKPDGNAGFSRYTIDAAGKTDVFVSCLGSVKSDWANDILNGLFKEHSSWDAPNIPAGKWGEYVIPTRCPLTQLVFDGFALLGDSACMAIPYIGTGIVNTLHGAKILANVINGFGERDSADINKLWKYQERYYRKVAKSVWRSYILNRWLQTADNETLENLFSSRIFGSADAQRIFTGRFLSLAPQTIFRRSLQLMLHPKLLLSIIAMFAQAIWAEECGRSIPEKYDEKRIAAWQQKMKRALD